MQVACWNKSNRRVQSSPRGIQLLWMNAALTQQVNVRIHCICEALRCRWPSLRLNQFLSTPFFFFSRFDIPARRVYVYACSPRFHLLSHPLFASSSKPVFKFNSLNCVSTATSGFLPQRVWFGDWFELSTAFKGKT